MSAIALEQRLEPYLAPRADPRPLAPVALDEEQASARDDFELWELHSELTLVSPELRRRSLELLPEPSDVFAARPPRPALVAAPAAEQDGPEIESVGVVRYTLHRVGDVTRFGLAVVGTIFTLAMLAEVVPH